MEIKDFIDNFASNFDETDTDSFTPETKFRDLDEWTSMLALATMAMVSEEYDVELTAEEMRNAQTIEDLFNTTKSHL
ncbi:MAG: acyl carrier protein [Bacteroidaceae bacterium]|nr:acyl carrier protein [Bacteroidaceae bacterium]